MKKLLVYLLLSANFLSFTPCEAHDLRKLLGELSLSSKRYRDDTLKARLLRDIMRHYADSNVDSAFYYRNILVKHCLDNGLENELAYVYYYTGVLYQIKSEFYQSLNFYYKALGLSENIRNYQFAAAACAGLAHTYSRLEQNARALTNCERGWAVLKNLPDSVSYNERLSLLNVQGVVYRKLRRFSEAMKTNRRMYDLAKTKPYDRWYESHGLHAIGLVFKEMGQIHQAMLYHQQALPIARLAGSVELEGNILINIADLYIREGTPHKALPFIQQARVMSIQAKNSGILAESYEKLYTVYRNLKVPAKALGAYEQYVSLRDSLLAEKNQQRIDALQEQYENARKTNQLAQQVELMKKENENHRLARTRDLLIYGLVAIALISGLLVWKNRQLNGKNIELLGKNAEIKEALFKGQTIERKRVALELHDNLSSLLSAVNMSVESMNPQSLTSSEQTAYQNVKQLIRNAYAEVRNISHNILPAELENEGLPAALNTLLSRLNKGTSLRFTLDTTGIHERLPIEIEYNLYSIALELINNVIKHAKAANVVIRIARTRSGALLSVTDDGTGFRTADERQGVGLQNINARLESLGGISQIFSETTKGTCVEVKIPIDEVTVNGNTLKKNPALG